MTEIGRTSHDWHAQLAKRDDELWAEQVRNAGVMLAGRALDDNDGDWEASKQQLSGFLTVLGIGTDHDDAGVK